MKAEWVSVKKMPKSMVRVDVWIQRERWPHRLENCFTDKKRKAFFKAGPDGSWEKIENVTHWMPLPEPPTI